ncbi:MAG: dihydropteroate synthase, partial [Chloroflexota bacterium]
MGVGADTHGRLRLRGLELLFGSRTYVMGILNATPDSFSDDGLMRRGDDLVSAAIARATQMVDEGADVLDIGGESTRPDHRAVGVEEELARVVDVVAALRAVLPGVPLSVDTSKVKVAEAALDAGADIINDVTAVTRSAALAPLAAARDVPYIIMHGRDRAVYDDIVAEVLADLAASLERAEAAGC